MKENWEINWKDYYKTLQVDPMAEPEVIEGVFTRLSKKYHPDVNPDPHASQHMKELNEAHDVLGNAEKRKQYHAVYLQRTGKSSSYGAPPPPRPSYTPPPIKPKPEVNPSMLRFQGLVPGESRREPFILKNSGGPYSKIWVSNSKSLWMNIVRQKPLSNLGKLPLLIEVEVLGTDWGKFYSDNIIIKLDNVEVSVRVEVQTQPKPEQPKSKETDEQKESDRINDLSDKTKRERTPNTIPQATQPKRRTIGIDLGTRNCVAAVMQNGKPIVISSLEGSHMFPSVVSINKIGKLLVGQAAKRQAIVNSENTVYSIKLFMGRKYGEAIGRELPVEEDVRRKTYKVIRGENNEVRVLMGGKEYSPPDISAMILQKLKTDAEAFLGEKVTDAVITVPAYFNDAQRQATKDAGTIAGLNVLRIINEPIAAALTYGLDKKKNEIIAVYDLGGGTFDISVLNIDEGTFQVKSTAGDSHLGGDDFDQRIIDWLVSEFKRDQGIDLSQDKMAMQRLKEAAEKAKIELSTVQQTNISIPFITSGANGPKHLNMNLNRAQLELLVMNLVEKTIGYCKKAIADAGKTTARIDEVILVGGQTRMPFVQQMVRQYFGKEPFKTVDPCEAIAIGAAIQAGVMKGEVKEVLLSDVTPLTISIVTADGLCSPIFLKNTEIPASKSFVWTTTNNNQSSIEIHIVQGEHRIAKDNKTLARLLLDGFLPTPRGMPQIEVTFDIDANGIFSVKALDKGTGKEQKITIIVSSGLSKDEIKKMQKG